MKKGIAWPPRFLFVSVFKIFIVLLCLVGVSPRGLYAERVRYVIDGDTLVLGNDQRVRLIGIDTPEIENPEYFHQGEFYGVEAKNYLKTLIEGKEVRLESGSEPFDDYGRRLAYVYLGDLFVNRELVRLGYAEVFRKFGFRYKSEFLELEASARAQKMGIWNPDLRNAYEVQSRKSPGEAWSFPLVLLVLAVGGFFYFRPR